MSAGATRDRREREGIAFAIRELLMTAAQLDQQPSHAARAMLAAFRDRAPRRLRPTIDRHGFAIFTTLLPERAELFDALKSASEDMAADFLHAIEARNGPQERAEGFGGINLPESVLGLSTALKSGLAAMLKRQPSPATAAIGASGAANLPRDSRLPPTHTARSKSSTADPATDRAAAPVGAMADRPLAPEYAPTELGKP